MSGEAKEERQGGGRGGDDDDEDEDDGGGGGVDGQREALLSGSCCTSEWPGRGSNDRDRRGHALAHRPPTRPPVSPAHHATPPHHTTSRHTTYTNALGLVPLKTHGRSAGDGQPPDVAVGEPRQ